MNRTKQMIGAIACAVAGLATGWVIHGDGERDAPPHAGPAAKSDQRSGKRPAPTGVADRVGRVAGLDDAGHRMKTAYAMAMSVPAGRIQEYLDGDYFDTPDPNVDAFFRQTLHDRWLDADPDAVLAYCLRKNHDSLTNRCMKEWARRDPTAAREFILNLPGRRELEQVAAVAVAEMAKTDQAGTIALIAELARTRGLNEDHFHYAIGTLATNDPEGLLQASTDWPHSFQKLALRKASSAKLAQDFMGAVAWMQEYPAARGRHMFGEGIQDNRKLATEFFKSIDRLPEGWARDVIKHHSWSLANGDPAACLNWTPSDLGMEEGSLKTLRQSAIDNLTNHHGLTSDQILETSATILEKEASLSDAERQAITKALAIALAYRDPEKARTWAAGLTDPSLQELATSHVQSTSAAERRPRSVTVDDFLANALKNKGKPRDDQAQYWPRHETAQAIDAFMALDLADQKMIGRNLRGYTSNLPFGLEATMVRQYLENSTPTERRFHPENSTGLGLTARWAKWEPAAAARWLTTLPPCKERKYAARQLIKTWRLQDPDAAERWSNRITADPDWDTDFSSEPEYSRN